MAGSNGLANPRDFLTPEAWYEDRLCSFTVVNKVILMFLNKCAQLLISQNVSLGANYLRRQDHRLLSMLWLGMAIMLRTNTI